MGEIAEDMIKGDRCSFCGIFFDDSYGFPIVCRPCFKSWKKENKKGKKQFLRETGLQVVSNG